MRLIKISMALVVFFTVVYVADGFPFWRGKPAYLNIPKWKHCTDEAIAAPGMNGQNIFSIDKHTQKNVYLFRRIIRSYLPSRESAKRLSGQVMERPCLCVPTHCIVFL